MFKTRVGVTKLRGQQKGVCGPTISLSLCAWFCTLPLVFFVVTPSFGWKVAGLTALGVLVGLLVACYGICTTRVYQQGDEHHD